MGLSVVLDTNVLVSGLRSRRSASHEILRRLGAATFEIAISVALVLEYEEILTRLKNELDLSHRDIGDFLDYVCSVSRHQSTFYLWRPTLRDPDGELVLEVAVAARCDGIVTHNTRDFAGASQFGLGIWTPGEFLRRVN
jgi:putative PIN family toxin of toxin-antitoxin system